MEKKATIFYYLLIAITILLLIIVFVLQNSITYHERQLKHDIKEYARLYNENNLLQAEWSYSLKIENFNTFTKNKISTYETILPKDNISIKDLSSVNE